MRLHMVNETKVKALWLFLFRAAWEEMGGWGGGYCSSSGHNEGTHGGKPHAEGAGAEAWKQPGNYQVSSGLPYSVVFFFFFPPRSTREINLYLV